MRYLNSFFITSIIYLIATFFLFFLFADTLIIPEKKVEETKISLRNVNVQQEVPTPEQTIQEKKPPEPIAEPVIEKKTDKPKPKKEKHHEHKKHHEKKPIKETIVEKTKETLDIKQEVVQDVKSVEKTPISNEPAMKQMDSSEIENIEAEYLSKIKSLIEKNKTYPKTAKRLNQTGKVYVTFTITKDGEIRNCRINKSSLFESLDEASLEILSKIANFGVIPKELNKSSWEITVPIVYQLNKN